MTSAIKPTTPLSPNKLITSITFAITDMPNTGLPNKISAITPKDNKPTNKAVILPIKLFTELNIFSILNILKLIINKDLVKPNYWICFTFVYVSMNE